jgi:NADH dehydrogenase
MIRSVVVFGGSGFLGRRIVQQLAEHGFAVRVASRHPERARTLFAGMSPALEMITADIGNDMSVQEAVEGAFGIVNAVSLYGERGNATFHSVHVEAAGRLARLGRDAGATRLVHVSGIGADAASPSAYIRSRAEGDNAVRAAFPAATILRSAVMFGPDDAFLMPLAALLRSFPVFPLFGNGTTRLQPVSVEDVAEATARIIASDTPGTFYELAGPRIWTYEALLRRIIQHLGVKRVLVPLPFAVWQGLAFAAEYLPAPFITRNQVELMEVDTVASPASPGFGALGIESSGIELTLAASCRTS